MSIYSKTNGDGSGSASDSSSKEQDNNLGSDSKNSDRSFECRVGLGVTGEGEGFAKEIALSANLHSIRSENTTTLSHAQLEIGDCHAHLDLSLRCEYGESKSSALPVDFDNTVTQSFEASGPEIRQLLNARPTLSVEFNSQLGFNSFQLGLRWGCKTPSVNVSTKFKSELLFDSKKVIDYKEKTEVSRLVNP